MRLTFVTLLLFAACGGSDSDPHTLGTCEGWVDNQGNPFVGMCEAACTSPPASTGMSCDTTARLGCPSFEFDGTDGCCIQDGTTIHFYECQ
jgi:hypothetical protein